MCYLQIKFVNDGLSSRTLLSNCLWQSSGCTKDTFTWIISALLRNCKLLLTRGYINSIEKSLFSRFCLHEGWSCGRKKCALLDELEFWKSVPWVTIWAQKLHQIFIFLLFPFVLPSQGITHKSINENTRIFLVHTSPSFHNNKRPSRWNLIILFSTLYSSLGLSKKYFFLTLHNRRLASAHRSSRNLLSGSNN